MARETVASANVPAQQKHRSHRKTLVLLYILLFVGLTVAFLCLTFIPKPNPMLLREFNLSRHAYYKLIIPLEILLVAIWSIGLYGALEVKKYSWIIKSSKDGQALSILSNGLLVLILMQPFGSALSELFTQIEHHHVNTIKPLTIVVNYIEVALVGTAFILIALGARRLYQLLGHRRRHLPQTTWVLAAIIASALYSYFVVIQPVHTPLASRVYFLPDWLLVLTIVVPYLCFWYFGLYGAYYTYLYQKGVKGRLYKRSLVYVASGITVVVVSSIATRVIVSLSTHLTNLKITPILVIIYALLLLEAIGFILIAAGALKLRLIEEV